VNFLWRRTNLIALPMIKSVFTVYPYPFPGKPRLLRPNAALRWYHRPNHSPTAPLIALKLNLNVGLHGSHHVMLMQKHQTTCKHLKTQTWGDHLDQHYTAKTHGRCFILSTQDFIDLPNRYYSCYGGIDFLPSTLLP
jgi:hypothetical protein